MLVNVLSNMGRRSFGVIAFALLLVSFITTIDPLQELLAKQDNYRKKHPQEKAHLHTDKNFYSIGDTLYFKAYLVNAEENLPSSISGVLHVDLVDERNSIVLSSVYPLQDGLARGASAIADTLRPGRYTLRAYTNWMLNGNAVFDFEKQILIGDGLHAAAPAGISFTGQTAAKKDFSFEFFPEGGSLVIGLPSNIAFKASTNAGSPMLVTGEVFDNGGKTVAKLITGFGGIGNFPLTPLAGKKYYALVKLPDGSEKKFDLPAADINGYVLSVDNTDKEKISISMSASLPATTNDLLLIALANNTIQYVGRSRVTGTTPAIISLAKKRFPTGILQLTLFDAGFLPVAERLAFIRQDDLMSIKVSAEKQEYKAREKIHLSIQANDGEGNGVHGSFSVSVTNESRLPFSIDDEQTILSNLLLHSDLTGNILQPNHYFNSITAEKEKELDNLLMTQGWNRFIWKDVIAGKESPVKFEAEKDLFISGTVLGPDKHPLANARITLISRSGKGFILDTTTGRDGRFRFDNFWNLENLEYSLQATSNSGNPDLRIVLDNTSEGELTVTSTRAPLTMFSEASFNKFLESSYQYNQEEGKPGNSGRGTTLKTVTVKAKKLTKVQEAVEDSWNLNGPGNADQVLTYLDLANCNNIGMCLQGRMTGVTVRLIIDPVTMAQKMVPFSNRGTGSPMMIIVDGMITHSQSLDDIPAQDIQSIEILRSGGYLNVYGTKGSQGVIVISTKSGKINYNENLGIGSGSKKPGNILFGKARGYAASREFYAPDYSESSKANSSRDLRTTIFWRPDLITDVEGKAGFEFYNADTPGTYRVVIEGLSADGKPGRQEFHYQVK